jgi:ketosteroid isomerase-like protein
MSRQNLEVIERGYAAWNRRDLQELLEVISPDFEFWPLPGFLDIEKVYRGKEGFKRFFETWWEAWTALDLSVERTEDLGDRVLALVLFDGVGRSSGARVTLSVGHLWSLRDGLIVRLDALEPDEAVEAAGLVQ